MNPKHKKLFDALQKRTSLRTARRVLTAHGFPKGIGWDQIVDKLKDPIVAADADYNGLEASLSEMLIAADKAVRIYKLSSQDAVSLRALVASLTINKSNVFASHFPYPVPDTVLSGLQPQAAEPIAKFSGWQSTGILFSSVNIIDVRERLTPNQIGATASQYDEVIGIKKIKMQTFDALIISKNKDYAYILTDAHHDTSNSTRNSLQSNMKFVVNSLVKQNIFSISENLLPLIEPIYNSKDGSVKRLHYTTTTSSGKQEWMRGTGNCLRDELSHRAGMKALSGGFKGYGIDIEFALTETHGYVPRPSLALIGSYRMTYEPNPRLEDAMLTGCANVADVESTLAELMFHKVGSKSI